jgi:hypothetical protein
MPTIYLVMSTIPLSSLEIPFYLFQSRGKRWHWTLREISVVIDAGTFATNFIFVLFLLPILVWWNPPQHPQHRFYPSISLLLSDFITRFFIKPASEFPFVPCKIHNFPVVFRVLLQVFWFSDWCLQLTDWLTDRPISQNIAETLSILTPDMDEDVKNNSDIVT